MSDKQLVAGLPASLNTFLEEGWTLQEIRGVNRTVLYVLYKEFPHMDSTQTGVAYIHARYSDLILEFDYWSEGRNVVESVWATLKLASMTENEVRQACHGAIFEAQRLISQCFGSRVSKW